MTKKEDLTYYETKIKLIKQIQLIINNMTVSELDYLIQELAQQMEDNGENND